MNKPLTIVVRIRSGYVAKGLIAIPKRLRHLFPKQRGQVRVLLDNGDTPQKKSYSPYESSTRQCRIGGLHDWYYNHKLKGGESVIITVIDKVAGIYRLTLGQREQEREAREHLHTASTEVQSDLGLKTLARLRQEPERSVALAELRWLAQQQREEARRRLPVRATTRHESIPANIRTLLKAVYGGRCQLCGFTFLKRDSEPYFQIHHVEAEKGNQLWNLLVVCPNCHAQLEHANIGEFERRGNWIVAVTISGERREVYQPLYSGSTDALLQAAHVSCLLLLVSLWYVSHLQGWYNWR